MPCETSLPSTIPATAPMSPQLDFALYDVKRRSEADPMQARDPMVQAAINGDLGKLAAGEHHDGPMKILAITHSGMTVDSFNTRVRDRMQVYQQPKGGRGLGGSHLPSHTGILHHRQPVA